MDYTLEINAGLTQVQQDGSQTDFYDTGRIAQVAETQTGYFLPDALCPMHQITVSSAALTLARVYDPHYGIKSPKQIHLSFYERDQ